MKSVPPGRARRRDAAFIRVNAPLITLPGPCFARRSRPATSVIVSELQQLTQTPAGSNPVRLADDLTLDLELGRLTSRATRSRSRAGNGLSAAYGVVGLSRASGSERLLRREGNSRSKAMAWLRIELHRRARTRPQPLAEGRDDRSQVAYGR